MNILVIPINPVEPLEATSYDHLGISVYFAYFIFMQTTINLHHMMNSYREVRIQHIRYVLSILFSLLFIDKQHK